MGQTQNWYEKPEYSGARQFLYLFLLTIGGLVLMGAISVFIMLAHFGTANVQNINVKNMPWQMTEYLMLVQDICLFGIPAIVFAIIVKRREDYFYVRRQSSLQMWGLIIMIAFSGLVVTDLMGQLNEWIPIPKNWAMYFKQMENEYNTDAAAVLNFKSFGTFVISLVTIALLPAIFEELFFRGALQQILIKCTGKAIPGIIITSIIFSAFHLSYYGFLPRVFLGVILGLVYYYGRNIRLNMLIHFINNATIVVALYVKYGNAPINEKILSDDASMSPWYLQIIGIVVLIAALILFIRKSKQSITNLIS